MSTLSNYHQKRVQVPTVKEKGGWRIDSLNLSLIDQH